MDGCVRANPCGLQPVVKNPVLFSCIVLYLFVFVFVFDIPPPHNRPFYNFLSLFRAELEHGLIPSLLCSPSR